MKATLPCTCHGVPSGTGHSAPWPTHGVWVSGLVEHHFSCAQHVCGTECNSADGRLDVLMDVDGVGCDFTSVALDHVYDLTGRRYLPASIRQWEIMNDLPEPPTTRLEVWDRMAEPGRCFAMPVLPDALAGMQALSTIANIVFVTSPFKKSATWPHERERWLNHHFPFHKGVVHTHHKERVHGDFLVDDRDTNILGWEKYWARRDPRCKAVLWKHRYNESMAPQWKALYDRVLQETIARAAERR